MGPPWYMRSVVDRNVVMRDIPVCVCVYIYINPLKTKRRPLYLKTQSVPRSKHFISVIKTNQFML